ncbi:MAG: hypothetical protein ACLFR1_14285, partial [Spirochaetia bacterium]
LRNGVSFFQTAVLSENIETASFFLEQCPEIRNEAVAPELLFTALDRNVGNMTFRYLFENGADI